MRPAQRSTESAAHGSRPGLLGTAIAMTRDPQIERIQNDLGMTHREEANRAITAGAAFAVFLCVAALVGVVAGAYWLIA